MIRATIQINGSDKEPLTIICLTDDDMKHLLNERGIDIDCSDVKQLSIVHEKTEEAFKEKLDDMLKDMEVVIKEHRES